MRPVILPGTMGALRVRKMGTQINVSPGADVGVPGRMVRLSGGLKGPLPAGFAGKRLRRVQLFLGGAAFVEDQAVDIVGEVGERDLRLGTRDADGADEQRHLVLLPSEHMFDAGADGGPSGIGARGARRHRLDLGLLSVDAADPADRLQPSLIGSAAVGGVSPHVRCGVVVGHYIAQHASVEARAVGDLAAADEPIAPADRDAAFVAEARDGDVDPRLAAGQRPTFGELQRPACVGI